MNLNKVINQSVTLSPYVAAEWIDNPLLTIEDDVGRHRPALELSLVTARSVKASPFRTLTLCLDQLFMAKTRPSSVPPYLSLRPYFGQSPF